MMRCCGLFTTNDAFPTESCPGAQHRIASSQVNPTRQALPFPMCPGSSACTRFSCLSKPTVLIGLSRKMHLSKASTCIPLLGSAKKGGVVRTLQHCVWTVQDARGAKREIMGKCQSGSSTRNPRGSHTKCLLKKPVRTDILTIAATTRTRRVSKLSYVGGFWRGGRVDSSRDPSSSNTRQRPLPLRPSNTGQPFSLGSRTTRFASCH